MSNIEGQDRAMKLLRKKTKSNDLDHEFIMECLQDWKNPAGKLDRLIKQNALIRLKNGFYIFGPLFRTSILSLPVIANKMIGPSYVSLEWALNYYGLIPEYVATITSVTLKSTRSYDTPIGRFTFDHIHPSAYPVEISWIEQPGNEHALIATKEKALTDFLRLRRGRIRSQKEMSEILLEDMRIEQEDLEKLNLLSIETIYKTSPHSSTKYLITFLKKWNSL